MSRPTGSKNKTTQLFEDWLDNVLDDIPETQWQHPIVTLLQIQDDETAPDELRISAAEKALKFMYPKDYKKIEITGADGSPLIPVVQLTRQEILVKIEQLAPLLVGHDQLTIEHES